MAASQEDRSSALLEAAASGSLALVQQHAAGGSDVDVADDKGRTPLLLAARSGHVDVVRYLIDAGADVNARDENGSTALFQATEREESEVGRLLIESGAEVDAADAEGATPLMIAAENGTTELVHCLVEHGADVNATDGKGSTPVMAASTWGLVDIVAFLVEHGADVNLTTEKGTTALIHAAIYGEVELVRYLIECGADLHAARDDGWTPLIAASRFGRAEAAQCLIEHGADVNGSARDGTAPLMYSSAWGHSAVARQLIDSGADVNTADSGGATPVMAAAANGHDLVVRHLIDSGVNVNLNDDQSRNAIHLAAKNGHSDIQRMLLPLLHVAHDHGSLDHSTPAISRQSGWHIPPFEIELMSFVDSGNFGGDYRAKWLDADVVVKLFVPDASSTTFENEVRVWRELRHPNVIKLYGACDARHQFFVCEYASNGSLLEYLETCAPECRAPWKHLYEAALGLEYLHERGIVHGNLRCSNILVGSDGMARLTDFGLSGSTAQQALATAESFGGSMRWQAIERLKGAAASFASDIYSLGLCLVEAVVGNVPWETATGILLAYVKANWHPESTDETTFEPHGLTGSARDLMLKMCSHNPELRPSITDVVHDIAQLSVENGSDPKRPRPIKATEADWGKKRQERIALFVSTISAMSSTLSEQEADEDQRSLLVLLNDELTTRASNYSADQLQLLQEAHNDIVKRVGNAAGPAPDWLAPWYELEINNWSCLGEGGFGSVHRAKWLDSEVVVKQVKLAGASSSKVAASFSYTAMSDSYSSASAAPATTVVDSALKEQRERALQMFKREADIWFGLRHPHVVRLFGACNVGTPFFVCEFAAKGTLIDYIRANIAQLRETHEFVWKKLHEAALGLLYLHERGVVHGDMKCNNIMVNSDEKARVTDFGLSSSALQVDGTSAQITGAWQWVAPECLASKDARPTFKSDVYSFGMCIIEAMRIIDEVLANEGDHVSAPYPWGGLDNIVVKVTVTTRRQLPARPRSCTDAEWSLIERMCKHDPRERIQMSTVVDELAMHAAGNQLSKDDEWSTTDPSSLMDQACSEASEMKQQLILQSEHLDSESSLTLSKIYRLLWTRIEETSGEICGNLCREHIAQLRSFIEKARAGTLAIQKSGSGLSSFTELAIRGYALHRQLDKLLEAVFVHKAVRDEASKIDWKEQCYAFLGISTLEAVSEDIEAASL